MLSKYETKAPGGREAKRPMRPTDHRPYREALEKKHTLRRQLAEAEKRVREASSSRANVEADLELEEGVAEKLGDTDRRDEVRRLRQTETSAVRDVRVLREALRRQEERVAAAYAKARAKVEADFRKWHRPVVRRLLQAYAELERAATEEADLFAAVEDETPNGLRGDAHAGTKRCAWPALAELRFAKQTAEKRAKEHGLG